MTNLLFEPPFGEVRGNVRTSSIARWKACGRSPIRDNWTFFANSYSWDVISRYCSKSAFFRWGGSVWSHISGWRGHRRPTSVSVSKLDWLLFHVISKYRQYILLFRHKARVWQTDGRTDRITISKTALASASRGKNEPSNIQNSFKMQYYKSRMKTNTW